MILRTFSRSVFAFIACLISGSIAAAAADWRLLAGPMTNRTLAEILNEMNNVYPDCDSLLADVHEQVVLDVGAGHSTLIPELKRLKPGLRAYRLDLGVSRADFAGDFVVGNAGRLPFAGGSIDRMFASYSLYLYGRHNEPLILGALREAARVLSDGGRLIISAGEYGAIARFIRAYAIPLEVEREDVAPFTALVLRRSVRRVPVPLRVFPPWTVPRVRADTTPSRD